MRLEEGGLFIDYGPPRPRPARSSLRGRSALARETSLTKILKTGRRVAPDPGSVAALPPDVSNPSTTKRGAPRRPARERTAAGVAA